MPCLESPLSVFNFQLVAQKSVVHLTVEGDPKGITRLGLGHGNTPGLRIDGSADRRCNSIVKALAGYFDCKTVADLKRRRAFTFPFDAPLDATWIKQNRKTPTIWTPKVLPEIHERAVDRAISFVEQS